jgi:hypothetical protein
MSESECAQEAYEKLKDQFNLPDVSRNELVDYNLLLERLKEHISGRLQGLLKSNHAKVFEILYKVDVPEHLIDEAFAMGHSKKASDFMAELIIRRQIKKIKTQREYKVSDDF